MYFHDGKVAAWLTHLSRAKHRVLLGSFSFSSDRNAFLSPAADGEPRASLFLPGRCSGLSILVWCGLERRLREASGAGLRPQCE